MTERPTKTFAEVLEAASRAAAHPADDADIAADDVGATATAQEVAEDAEAQTPDKAAKPDA